jgi:HEAT repeat protein
MSALARDADAAATALLEDGLWSVATPDARRLDFAEALARIPAPSSARPALLELALSERPCDRRRSLYALGALAPGPDTVTAASTALGDRDPSVRAAGVWAVERAALSAACESQLRGLGETDSSEDVRRSARRALEQLESEAGAASP